MNNDYIMKLYETQQYGKIVDIYQRSEINNNCTPEMNLFAGFVFTEIGMPQKAVQCLISLDKLYFTSYVGKINRYIGLSYYMFGEYKLALSFFERGVCEKDNECELWKKLLYPVQEERRITKYAIFHFTDKFDVLNEKIFIAKNLEAINRISRFIGNYNLNKKIDIYVYAGRRDSIGNPLSYADNGLMAIHTHISDARGHEIAHLLFNNIYKYMIRNTFIDEGIATFFNESDSFESFCEKYKKYIPCLDIIELWNSPCLRDGNNQSFYYLAGAFVGFLIKIYGKEKFLEFISDESYKNAKILFSPCIDNVVEDFYQYLK